MIKYNRLWSLLRTMGLNKTDLHNIISGPTIAALTRNEYVKLTTIENLCKFLQCTPNDIMEIDMEDMTHAAWNSSWNGKEKKTKYRGKTIIPALEMMEKMQRSNEESE